MSLQSLHYPPMTIYNGQGTSRGTYLLAKAKKTNVGLSEAMAQSHKMGWNLLKDLERPPLCSTADMSQCMSHEKQAGCSTRQDPYVTFTAPHSPQLENSERER